MPEEPLRLSSDAAFDEDAEEGAEDAEGAEGASEVLPGESEQVHPLSLESQQIIDELLKRYTTVNVGSMPNATGAEDGEASTSPAG